MFSLIKATFGQRRKTLVNALSNQLHLPKEQLLRFLEERNLSPTVRGETFTLERFAELANDLSTVSAPIDKN